MLGEAWFCCGKLVWIMGKGERGWGWIGAWTGFSKELKPWIETGRWISFGVGDFGCCCGWNDGLIFWIGEWTTPTWAIGTWKIKFYEFISELGD